MNETEHQAALIEWCELNPLTRLIFAVPNGTNIRSHQGRSKAKREGLKSGVPDLFLPVSRHGFNGLFIEMKKPKCPKSPAGKLSKNQSQWLSDLSEQGYMAVVCTGWDAARETITSYLKGS